MITCSIPEATASSTAYWITGLSTRGSISFGCALVAGRNRVPHPAAGNTAFRTRIEPHVGERAWSGSGPGRRIAPGPCRTRSRSGGERADEFLDERGEDLGPVDVREVAGARNEPVRDPRHAREEPARPDPEDEVE